MNLAPARILFVALLLASTGCASAQGTDPQTAALKPADILAGMEKVADWQLAHPAPHPPTTWTQGTLYTGIMALAKLSASSRFHDAMMKMGEAAGWEPASRSSKSIYHADDQCVGQTYIDLYLQHHDPKMIGPLKQRLDYIRTHPKDDNLLFDKAKNPDYLDRWSWCDSLYMAPPTWVKLSVATGDPAYMDYAVKHWWITSAYLFDKTAGLFFRDSTYFNQSEANGRKVFWGRGNGWVMAALVHMLENLPQDHPDRQRFIDQYQTLAKSILACQQPDGLWRASLLDPKSYPLKESSASGFYCYAFVWGVNHGLLNREEYAPAALKAWTALCDCVEADGKLTHVQPIGADPKHFPDDATEAYGVGAYLLAGSEIYRFAGGEVPGASSAAPAK